MKNNPEFVFSGQSSPGHDTERRIPSQGRLSLGRELCYTAIKVNILLAVNLVNAVSVNVQIRIPAVFFSGSCLLIADKFSSQKF